MWALGFVPNVTIDSVTGVSTVTDDPSVFRLLRVEQRLAGAWVKLDKETPARVKAGKKLRLRVVLGNPGGNETVPADLPDPGQGGWSARPAVPRPRLPVPVRDG